jgi:3-methylcrotonyl-CoA carboxylase alpha subunit
MIAKIVVHAASRSDAILDLARVCGGTEISPVRTNAAFLRRALLHSDFQMGEVTTGFIAAKEDELATSPKLKQSLLDDAATATVFRSAVKGGTTYNTINYEQRIERQVGPVDVWRHLLGLRLNSPDRLRASFGVDGKFEEHDLPADWKSRFVSSENTSDGFVVFDEGEALPVKTRFEAGVGAAYADGAILAPMPGKVTSVEVSQGEKVAKGQRLLTLEAMKMEHGLVAPFDGVVAELNADAGAQVQVDAVLVVVEPASSPA